MNNKKIVLRVFFVAEIIFFVVLYFVSPEGFSAVQLKKQETKALTFYITQLSNDIKKLEQETQKWEHNSFYQEKIAREQLQMARPTDEVYRIS